MTDVQRMLGHKSVKTRERSYAAFKKNKRYRQTIELLDEQTQPDLKVVR